MAINLELPRKLQAVMTMTHQGAAEIMRPVSRKYDLKEHTYPVELDTMMSLFEGVADAKSVAFAGPTLSATPNPPPTTTTAPTWPRCCRRWRPAGVTSR
ncbi:putative acyl-CoA dehydrogenase domain protein [Mycobacterium kansasii]|uniref:Putative acyl-CoA dehydrogenase domain protein n=1 Tax=Mycobacterium kansasii TaxID=1768 RepID=A0A1V3XZS6_MYCKA|nr:putative acyl-CoA dehydrogenase domain protein [Mycobacterium kansasii]